MINATGDVVVGDRITFTEAVWDGNRHKPKKIGDRTIVADVVKDSYGAAKQQHTFTLEVVASKGFQPLQHGKRILRKGRNIYRNGVQRERWNNEKERRLVAIEKHQRGDEARSQRAKRKKLWKST